MGDIGRPDDLEPLKEPLIESVINFFMATNKDGTAGLEFDHGSCAEGEFRFKKDAGGLLDPDTKVYVSYPGGQWKVDETLSPDNEIGSDESPMFGVSLFDATAVYSQIRDLVSDWVDPWIAGHSPNEFNNQIASIAHLVDQLYVQDVVQLGGNPVSTGSTPGATSKPVGDVLSCINDMRSELSSLNGLAIDALERAYVNDIGLTISGQRALCAVAGLAIAGEAEAWSQAYLNLADFFAKATSDFNSFAAAKSASGKGTQSTLSIISTVAGAAGAASFAFPPAAATLGIVSGIAAVGAAFWPTDEAVAATIVVLEGGSYDEVWSSFEHAVRDVDKELTAAERGLGRMCSNALDDLGTYPDSFSITARSRDGQAQPNDNLPCFLHTGPDSKPGELYAGDEVRIVHSKLHAVAGMIEHIGDHQMAVAKQLGGADSSGNPSALVASEWSRPTLQGIVIGNGYSGHYGDFAAVVNALVDLLISESKTAHRTAEHCLDVSTNFRLTEDQIESQLDKLESRLG